MNASGKAPLAKNLYTQMKASKKPYQICTRCVMDTSDPTISFNADGHCNHCERVETQIKGKVWFPHNPPRQKAQLQATLEEIKAAGRGKPYDCVIGLSGGVDSSFLAHLVVKDWGLRPLAIHVDAGWNSEVAVHNIEVLVRGLDLDLYTEVIDWETVQDLQRAYMLSGVENQDVPQDHVFFAILNKLVIKHKLRYFLSGGNYATESILPSSWGYDASDSVNIVDIHKKFGRLSLEKYALIPPWKRYIYYRFGGNLKTLRLLDYYPYERNRAIELITNKYGWRNYGDKHHESRWTRWFQAHYLPYKFGIDKRRAHWASMVVAGEITREEALEWLKRPLYDDDQLFIDTEYVRKKLQLGHNEYLDIMNSDPKLYSEYKNSEWIRIYVEYAKKLLRR